MGTWRVTIKARGRKPQRFRYDSFADACVDFGYAAANGSTADEIRLSHVESNQLVGVRYCPRPAPDPFPGEPTP